MESNLEELSIIARNRNKLAVICMGIAVLASSCRWEVVDDPELTEIGTIETTELNLYDSEGLEYDDKTNELWIADDNGGKIVTIDRDTGLQQRVFDRNDFLALPQKGGGSSPDTNSVKDVEAFAFNEESDSMFAFFGKCCNTSVNPIIVKFERQNGAQVPVEFQYLPTGSDFSGAAHITGDQFLVTVDKQIAYYDYESNTTGTPFSIPGTSGNLFGLDYIPYKDGLTSQGGDLLALGSGDELTRTHFLNGVMQSVVDGYNFDLSVDTTASDPRAVLLIEKNDETDILIADGNDTEQAPQKYDISVTKINGTPISPLPPVAILDNVVIEGRTVTADDLSYDPDGTEHRTYIVPGDGSPAVEILNGQFMHVYPSNLESVNILTFAQDIGQLTSLDLDVVEFPK